MAVSKPELERMNETFGGKNSNNLFTAGLLTNIRMNSGSRIIMVSQQMAQYVIPKKAEFPLIYTGFENAFGKYSDSVQKSEANYKIIDIISKYLLHPRHCYYYVVQNLLTGVYDVIEVNHFIKYSETHGFLKQPTVSDALVPGAIIPENTLLSKTSSMDEYGNYKMGVRANMCYISIPETEEDGYVLSDEFAEKTSFYQIEEAILTVNNNTILPNLYGNKEEYKAFPDLFEEVKDGIICARRQVNFSYAASELTENALSSILDNDKCIPGQGIVVDIDVFVNNEEELLNNSNRIQLTRYWMENKNYHKKIVDVLSKIIKQKSSVYSYKLKMLYERSIDFLNDEIKFASANGIFEFALIKFTTAYETKLKEGYKICDRHGSKGVTCHILPKEYMPVDAYGTRADIIQSPPSIISRANAAQCYEHELNFISNHIRRLLLANKDKDIESSFQILYEYISIIDAEQALSLKLKWKTLHKLDKIEFIADCITDGIYIRQAPFLGNITFEKIDYLYTKYDVHPSKVRMKKEFRRHNFSRPLIKKQEESYFATVKTEDGKLATKGISPLTADEDIILEVTDGKDKFKFTDEGYIPGVHDGQFQLVSYDNKTEEVKQLAPLETESPEDMLIKTWGEETRVETRGDVVIRSFISKTPVIIAEKYFLILKHVPEGKLSARFVGSTSALGLPNKTTKTETNGPFNQAPIKSGEMEMLNMLIRVSPDVVYRYLSVVSKDPELRSKLFNILLYEDPLTLHNISDIKQTKFNDIPPKVLNAFLLCMGYEVVEDKKDDVYNEFDELDLTDKQLEKIFEKHAKSHPIANI